jgi:hypothetical protein
MAFRWNRRFRLAIERGTKKITFHLSIGRGIPKTTHVLLESALDVLE